jgi:lysozyme
MTQKRTLAAVIGATAATIVLAFTGMQEGSSNTPYRDSGGVWTVCTGQTGVPMHYYTDSQCSAMLANTLETTAAQLAAGIPGFTTRTDGQKAAAVDLAYNIGVHAFFWSGSRPSTISRQYESGAFPAACDSFLNYKLVDGKDCSVRANNCYGVWTRRQAERSMCLGSSVH